MYFDSTFGRIYYEVHGLRTQDRQKPADETMTVLFVHGVTMDHRTFESQINALQTRFRVVCLDLPGHGQSEKVDLRGRYSCRAARAINELLDELRAERVVLVGQSLGSLVCQRAAVEAPGRVVGSVHLGGWSLYPRVSPLMTLFKPLVSLSIGLFPRKPLYALFAAHKALEPQIRVYLQEVCTAAGKRLIRLLTVDMIRDMVEGIPHRLEHPMLICHGDHEAGFIRRHAAIWHAAQEGSSHAVIEHAHHIANQDNPSAFNGRLVEYLDSVTHAGQITSAAGDGIPRLAEQAERTPCYRS